MHQPMIQDPYDFCDMYGCNFIEMYTLGDVSNFYCDRCGESMSLSSQAEKDFIYAWNNLGIYLYG